ncbi:MAG: 50S ribosomal protein L7/L12 [Candidatus Babeliales bacterium]
MSAKSYDKLIDEIGNMSVLQLSEFVKALEEKFDVSAAAGMPMMAAAPAVEAGAKAEEKTEFKVTLQEGGPEKIKTIKALRSVTTLGLAEAKQAVENAPTVIGEAVAKDKANEMKKALEEVGAKVELA